MASPQVNPMRFAQGVVVATWLGGAMIGWGLSTLWSKSEVWWHRSRCPVDAFLFGGLGGVLSPFLVGTLAFCVVILASLSITSRYDLGRVAFAAWSPPSRNPSLAVCIKITGWLTAILFIFSTALCAVDFFNSYCLSPSGIQIQRTFFGKNRKYHWGNVKGIQTICWKGKGDQRVYHMDAILADGYRLQLPEYRLSLPVTEADIPYFPGIKAALTGATFSFDSSTVEPSCSSLRALIQKP